MKYEVLFSGENETIPQTFDVLICLASDYILATPMTDCASWKREPSRDVEAGCSRSAIVVDSPLISTIYPFMPNGFFYLNFLDQSISSLRGA